MAAVCPECRSSSAVKKGLRYPHGTPIQRYLCKSCGYRFSEKPKNQKIQTYSRQISVLNNEMKNLAAEAKNKSLLRGNNNASSNLVNFSWYLKKLGRAEETVLTYTNYVKNMGKLAELNDPEAIKGVIATHYKDKNTQRMACCSYDAYLKFMGGKWEKPRYRPEHKQVFIPTEEELRLAINTGHKENFVFSKFLYETGARSNEAQKVRMDRLGSRKQSGNN